MIRLLVLLLLVSNIGSAKLFRNSYVQFELPEGWNCQLKDTVWDCVSNNKIASKESTILFTAKELGPQDSFQAYSKFLATPKRVPGAKPGQYQVSIIKRKPEQRNINGHPWLDALHLGSEVPGYYTRYLATIKDRLAILVTLSAHQKYYTKYSRDYITAAESLRVVATKDMFKSQFGSPAGAVPMVNAGGGFQPPPAVIPSDTDFAPPPQKSSSGSASSILLGVALLVAAFALYSWKKQ